MSRVFKYKDDEHFEFYMQCIEKVNAENDTYRKSFFYVMGILPETRQNIHSLYDFEANGIKIEGLSEPWQTSDTLKVCRLAMNLYNGFNYVGKTWFEIEKDTSGAFTPYHLFNSPEAFYMLEGIKIRYPNYTKED